MDPIETFPTGVPGLDRILGGGLPRLSFNIVAGDPGGGKTTLAHQIVFANATEERRALYVTVVGEPPVKMLRYQQAFPFYDPDRVGRAVHYRNLSTEAMAGDLGVVLERIRRFVEELEPGLVVVDSFRSVVRLTRPSERNVAEVQSFVQRLAADLARWEATTFLVGEFRKEETPVNPVFTVADGLFWLRHHLEGDARVRKLEVSKLRGGAELSGRHVYRIGDDGIRVYPRGIEGLGPVDGVEGRRERLGTGVPRLDEIMGGGVRRGDAVVVSGPSGCGKSVLAAQFVAEGSKRGESSVVALFEEGPERYLERGDEMGLDLRQAEEDGRLRLLARETLDLSVDETFEEIRDAVEELGATRVVIDSLSGLQVVAAGGEAERLRQAMSRVVRALVRAGVTVLVTAELHQQMDELRFTPHESSFLADDLILMRYVEVRGELQSVLSVIKMRRSPHSRAFHRYGITSSGVVVGESLEELRGILTGVPDIGDAYDPRDSRDWEEVERDGASTADGSGGDAREPSGGSESEGDAGTEASGAGDRGGE